MNTGKLIALEGIDGSGKGTQSQLLVDFFRSHNTPVKIFHFPQYDSSFFGKEVGKYLHGDYGQLSEVHPKFSALLYALDRFEARAEIVDSLNAGITVICDRYTPSNIAHQSARTEKNNRNSMIEWIQHVEYEILLLPRPDIVIFLDSTVHSSQTLVRQKSRRSYTDKIHDIQEASEDHLQVALEQFRTLATNKAWKTIHCLTANGKIRSPIDIHKDLIAHVHEIL